MSELPLPAPLRPASSFPFVGRSRELHALRSLLPDAESDGARVVLVGGEPGSGKSRLVRELACAAAGDGILVLYGASDAAVQRPYGAFVDALEELVRRTDPDTLRADLGTGGDELTRLLSDLPRRVGELEAPVAADAATARHRLHTAVADLLANVTARQGVLLALEDIHWADAATLLLLRHLARSAGNARMLVLATFRDSDADVADDLSEALADLRRWEGVIRLRLTALSEDEVAAFVREATGGDLGPDLGEVSGAISDLTDGNPFLMTELWRSLVETGSVEITEGRATLTGPLGELGSPESVREVVAQRLSRASQSTTEVLQVAAVAGPEFALDVLQHATGLDDRTLLAALEEGVRNGTIEAVPATGLGYRFTHELVRRALYDGLSSLRRAELHLRVGEALEESTTDAPDRALDDLAHHFAAAAPLGESGRAFDYNRRAGRAAMRALAFDRAAACLKTALAFGAESPSERAEIQLELGDACRRAGASLDALEAFAAAARIGREIGDADLLARAAIGFEDACWHPGIAERRAADLLEEAAAAFGEGDSSLRVSVLSGLARALAFRGGYGRAAIVRANAVQMARALGDRAGLGALLVRAYWTRGVNTREEIRDMLIEAMELGEELSDYELQQEARGWLTFVRLWLGELKTARREFAAQLEAATRSRQPAHIFTAEHTGSAIALCEGNLDEAEARARRAFEWEELLTPGVQKSGIHGIQMFSVRREQGRLAELGPVVRALADGDDSGGAWRPGLIALLVEVGMEEEARREVAWVRAHGLEPFHDALWLASLSYLTDASAALRDAGLAALLVPLLKEHAGTPIVVGHVVACYGAADRYLGMLSATLRDWEAADRYFESAGALDRRMGADTWLAHTAYEHARMLFARGRAADAERAAALQAEAAALAERIGMPALLARIRLLGSPAASKVALPDGLSPRELQILCLVARGLSNRKIGEELFISEHTAANHIRSILRKTSCANRTEAATYAHQHGFAER